MPPILTRKFPGYFADCSRWVCNQPVRFRQGLADGLGRVFGTHPPALQREGELRAFRGRFFVIICQDAPSIRQLSRRDRTPIAHRFIGGFKDDHMMTVPEGRQPAFRPDSGERPSGTGIYCLPVFPPINRWAIGDLSLPGRKTYP